MSERYGYDGDEPDSEEGGFAPGDPDYDLSEEHGYAWYPGRQENDWPLPRWALAVISVAVVAALVLPTIFFIMRAT